VLVKWPHYCTQGRDEMRVYLTNSDRADAWWKTASDDARILSMMRPAHFKHNKWTPHAADGLHDEWPQRKYMVTRTALATFHTTMQETRRQQQHQTGRSASGSGQQPDGPRPPKPTMRMRRNYRKFFAASAVNRVWVKDMVTPLVFSKARKSLSAFCRHICVCTHAMQTCLMAQGHRR